MGRVVGRVGKWVGRGGRSGVVVGEDGREGGKAGRKWGRVV